MSKIKRLGFYTVFFAVVAVLSLSVNVKQAASKKLLVTNSGNNTVSVIDASKEEVVMTWRVGVWPSDIAVDRRSGMAYVINSHSSDNTVSVIDIESNEIKSTIAVDVSPMHITLDSASKRAYVTHTVSYANTISIIDLSKNVVSGKVKVGDEAFDMVLLNDKLYVSNSGDKTISVIDTRDNSVVDLIMVKSIPLGLAADEARKKVFVAAQDESSVIVLDAECDKVMDTISIDQKDPWHIGIDTARNRAYVTNRGDGTISVIDTVKHKVLDTIKVGKQPVGIAVDSAEDRVYVVNHDDMTVSVINMNTNKVIGTIKESLTPSSPYSGSPWSVAVY